MDNMIEDKKKTINKMNKIAVGIFLALTTQGYSGHVFANTPAIPANENDVVLDKLKVEGTGNDHDSDWIYDEPRSVSEITRDQLDNRPARHAADILEETPGVYSSVSQQDPALSVNIRGIQDYGRVNMNVDGMRQNFMKSGHGQRHGVMYIDPEILGNVVIEKGVSSGIGGAGVIGGVATFNTINASDFLAPGKEIGGQLRATTGDNGTQFIGSGVLALGNEYGDLLLAASERNLKDYWPGNKGKLAEVRLGSSLSGGRSLGDELKHTKVTNAGYKMHSQLAKVGWNIDASQRLAFSYLQTQVFSPNASMLTMIYDRSKAVPTGRMGWENSGVSDVMTRNIGLDYSLNPGNIDWLDATAKFYYVDTNDKTDTYISDAVFRKKFWTQTSLSTRGLQLQNTNDFTPTDAHHIRLQYGVEWFSDRSKGNSTHESMKGVTPPGKRSITSTFAQLKYDYDDWLRLEGGLRYDQFRLQGNTWLYTEAHAYPYTRDNPCKKYSGRGKFRSKANPACLRQTTKMTWDVDRRERQFSPTAAVGIKPGIEWLELFGSYGKSWRPPAMTEVLATGTAHGSGWILPNPFIAAERSRAWEAGVNIQQSGLVVNDDRFAAKVAYFDTRVTDYINLELSRRKPKLGGASFANATYMNNLLETRFRGLEYQLSYDAGSFYTNINYTKMIGSNNICSRAAWLGGVQGTKSLNNGNEVYTVELDSINNSVKCINSMFGSGAYLPGDRGSLTLGGRIFDRRLDFGTIIRYNKGHQDKSVLTTSGGATWPTVAYVADWPKYTVFDLYASYQVTSDLTLRSSIENITNRAYLVSYGDSLSFSPNRGRTIQGGFEYKF